MTIEITRREWFREVWVQPFIQVAPRFGISNVALKEVRRQREIAVAGGGYWARKEAGKEVSRALVAADALDNRHPRLPTAWPARGGAVPRKPGFRTPAL